jgi:hypothetical protein
LRQDSQNTRNKEHGLPPVLGAAPAYPIPG